MTTLYENTVTATHSQVPPHILVMDDEENLAKGLKMVLTEEGYAVDVARTGQDALDSFTREQFDLLVADLRLPDINGMDVIRTVKQKWPETGVIVITGYATVRSAVDAMKLGTYDYLPKPFTDDEIKYAVDGVLKGRQSISADQVIQKVESKDEEKLIQKQKVLSVLERTLNDEKFWIDLMENPSSTLESFHLSHEAKAAIASGDLKWIEKHVGKLTREQLAFMYKRLEREAW
jgi:DNA-binding response OmpR family regulator